jgi:hypothetical protein
MVGPGVKIKDVVPGKGLKGVNGNCISCFFPIQFMESTGISPKIQVSEILPMSLVPPNQFELSDCQEVIVNNTYIWNLPASPLVFGLFGPTGPLSVTDHMATQIKPEVPAVHVALVHFQLCSTL